jgi:hypothetical protein
MNEINELQVRLDKISMTYEEIITKSVELARIEQRQNCIAKLNELLIKNDDKDDYAMIWNKAVQACMYEIYHIGA